MMDKNVQMEIVAVVGIIGVLSLVMNRPDIASVVVAGLVGFLGGQNVSIKPLVNTDLVEKTSERT
jgi:hypothetical protein